MPRARPIGCGKSYSSSPENGSTPEVRLARRGAEPEDGRQPRPAEVLVELELLAGDVEEAAEVDVVHACGQAASHDRQVEAVGDAVHADRGTAERGRDRVGVARVDLLLAFEPCVAARRLHSSLLQEAN